MSGSYSRSDGSVTTVVDTSGTPGVEMPKTPKGAKRPADVIGNASDGSRLTDRLWDMTEVVEMIDRASLVPATQSE